MRPEKLLFVIGEGITGKWPMKGTNSLKGFLSGGEMIGGGNGEGRGLEGLLGMLGRTIKGGIF